MSRKKAPQTQYIAIDDSSEELIAVGNREEVTNAVHVYVDSSSLDLDELDHIKIFELGPEKNLLVEAKYEVSF
jgi:hypothetical protein